MTSEKMTAESVITQIWVVILIGRAAREVFFSQSEALPRSVISMEFLQSFLRRHFAGKPVVASRNVEGSCMLFTWLASIISFTFLCTAKE